VLRMFPVWVSMVLFFAVTAQMSSTFIEQGHTMDNHVGPFTVPPASLAIFDIISVMFCVPIYDRVLVPLARRATGKERGLSQLQRLGVGLALSVAGIVYAALVEARRLSLAHAAPDTQPSMSIMWQAPAFAVLGAGEVFTAIGILDRVLLRSVAGRHEEPRHGPCAARRRGRQLLQLCHARRRRGHHDAQREARVDPRRPEQGPPGLFLLVNGCSWRGEPAVLPALLHQVQRQRRQQHIRLSLGECWAGCFGLLICWFIRHGRVFFSLKKLAIQISTSCFTTSRTRVQ